MVSKMIVAVCVLVAVVSMTASQPTAGWTGAWGAAGPWGGPAANPFIPPWIATAPWMPQWTPCTTVGSTCLDCTTKVVCTKMGAAIQRACTDPTLPHCNMGACSATPSAECAPVETVPAVPAA